MKEKKESTIGILSNLISFMLELYQSSSSSLSSTSKMTSSWKNSSLTLMTKCCTLISVLCRFDDFREQQSNNGDSSMVDSSYGGVSSAHDHVLEFNREGIIPTLHELILLSLEEQKKGGYSSKSDNDEDIIVLQDQFGVGLAAAAMSATRVLAVNDEIVQALVAVGILKSVKTTLDMGVPEDDYDHEDVLVANVEERKEEQQEEEDDEVEKEIEDTIDTSILLSVHREQLTAGAIGLIRNLCGNDEIKTTLCLGTSTPSNEATDVGTTTIPSNLPSIIRAMKIYKKNATIQEHGCGTLAAMALRKPSNALRIVHEDGASSILTAMKLFPSNVLVQRQGALAIRNIVSRLVANTSATESLQQDEGGKNSDSSNEKNSNGMNVRDIFLDLGAEVILRGITGRHQGSLDEAYAALRDLGCPVSMVKYDAETQTTTTKTVMFGDVKPNFRPVYEES